MKCYGLVLLCVSMVTNAIGIRALAQPQPVNPKGVTKNIRGGVNTVKRPTPCEYLDKLENIKTYKDLYALNTIRVPQHKTDYPIGIPVTVQGLSWPCRKVVLTDTNGQYKVTGLVNGRYCITTEMPVMDGGKKKISRARFVIDTGNRTTAWLTLRTDLVTVKGRVVNADGNPVSGIHLRATAEFGDQATSEWHLKYPDQTATTSEDGTYELLDLTPAEFTTVAGYLMDTNSVECGQELFHALLYVKNPSDMREQKLVLKTPLFGEETLANARRYIALMDKLCLAQKGRSEWKEAVNVPLPRIIGNVIIAPDIVLDSGENEKSGR